MIKRKIAFSALAFFVSLGAFAQTVEESVELTLDEAVDYALKNNRTLKSSDIDLEMKERAAKYSWNVLLPSLTVSGTLSRATEISPSLEAMGKSFESEEDHWSTIGNISLGWNFNVIYLGQMKAAKIAYETGKITLEQSQKEVALSIKKAFYNILLLQENIKIQKATLENKRQRMVQAQTSFRNGAIPELKLLQTQVDYQNAKPDVESAEQNFNQLVDTFAALQLGFPAGTKLVLKGEIAPKYIDADVQELVERYGNNDLNIKSLKGNIESANINFSSLKLSVWVPTVSINYGWQPAYAGDKGAFHFWGDIGKDKKWYDSGNLSFTLSWNITNMLPWSSTQQKIKDTDQQIKKLEISLETLQEKQKVDVKAAVDKLTLAKLQIDAMGRNVTVAQRAYDATYRSYRNGMTELLDLRDAEQSLNQAKLGLLQQKINYITALLDLENTLNTNLTESE